MERRDIEGGPLHMVRCIGQLALMYVQEIRYELRAALDDDAWPDDPVEDQQLRSGRWPTPDNP